MSRPRMDVNIGGIAMKNPVMVASGTFGYGEEYADLVDISKLGAVVVKGIGLDQWDGNPPPRLAEVRGGLVNAIGLQNPGVDGFVTMHMPFLRNCGSAVIVNIWGKTVGEYVEVAARLEGVAGISGLELNVSCPNIKEGGIAFGSDPGMLSGVVAAVRKRTALPLIVKLPPNVPDIRVLAKAAEESGADALSLINTIPAMVVDIESRKPFLSNITGGLSGPAIHPVAVKLVWDAYQAVKIDIVGIGGVASADDAIELMIAGAAAVAVGTANFMEPATAISVVEGIERYIERHGLGSAGDLVGSLVLEGSAESG